MANALKQPSNLLMPKATAVWLIENTMLSFRQIADFVELTEIEVEAPLFREGLGLDSIDALELSLAISQQYGVQLRAKLTRKCN